MPSRRGSVGGRASVALMLLLWLGCGGHGPASQVPPSAPPAGWLDSAWPARAATDPSIDDRTIGAVGALWLGSGGDGPLSCLPLGDSPPPVPAVFARRFAQDESRALLLLARLDAAAVCALGRTPGAFGEIVPEGHAVGALACEAVGDVEGAARARTLAGITVLPPWSPAGGADARALLVPAVRRAVLVEGEQLEFDFVLPEQWAAAAKVRTQTPAEGSALDGFVEAAGTANWPTWDLIPTPASLLEEAAPGPGRRGAVETRIDGAAARVGASLGALPAPGLKDGAADLIVRFVLFGLRRDTGLAALEQGDPGLASVLLEDALGANPPAGSCRDSLGLAALALAHHLGGDHRRAIENLGELAERPGWDAAQIVRHSISRLVVLPGEAVQGAKR